MYYSRNHLQIVAGNLIFDLEVYNFKGPYNLNLFSPWNYLKNVDTHSLYWCIFRVTSSSVSNWRMIFSLFSARWNTCFCYEMAAVNCRITLCVHLSWKNKTKQNKTKTKNKKQKTNKQKKKKTLPWVGVG